MSGSLFGACMTRDRRLVVRSRFMKEVQRLFFQNGYSTEQLGLTRCKRWGCSAGIVRGRMLKATTNES